jgi:hypothetical protein
MMQISMMNSSFSQIRQIYRDLLNRNCFYELLLFFFSGLKHLLNFCLALFLKDFLKHVH